MNKSIKKLVSICCLCCFIATTSVVAGAVGPSNYKTLGDLQINYETMLGHNNRSYKDIFAELMSCGLNETDAEYYAKMDILANQIEIQDIHLEDDLQQNAIQANQNDLSTKYLNANATNLREEALNLNPDALNVILSQNQAMVFGANDSRTVLNNAENRKAESDDNISSMTVKYPDGSEFVLTSTVTSESEDEKEVITNTSVAGPWNKEWKIEGNIPLGAGTHTIYTDWQYKTGTSYAKVRDTFKCNVTLAGGKYDVRYVSDTGSSSFSGVVTVDIENLSNHQNESATWRGEAIQGYTDVRFTVSGNFSVGYGGLTLSVNGGDGWHQYAVTEVDYVGNRHSYAAQFV